MLNCPGLSQFLLRHCGPQYQLSMTCRCGCTLPLPSSSSRYQIVLQEGCKIQKRFQMLWKDQGKNLKTAIKQRGLKPREGQSTGKGMRTTDVDLWLWASTLLHVHHVISASFSTKTTLSPSHSVGWAAAPPARRAGGHGAVPWSLHGGTVEWVTPTALMHCLSYSCRNTLAPSSTYAYKGVTSP